MLLLELSSMALFVPAPPAPVGVSHAASLLYAHHAPAHQQISIFPAHQHSSIFPHEVPSEGWSPITLMIAEDPEQLAAPEDPGVGKSRGRIILALIVCNSIFWQYLYPTLKGEENALGKLLNRDKGS